MKRRKKINEFAKNCSLLKKIEIDFSQPSTPPPLSGFTKNEHFFTFDRFIVIESEILTFVLYLKIKIFILQTFLHRFREDLSKSARFTMIIL